MTNPTPFRCILPLALALTLAACEATEGGELCDEIAFAAPSCALACPWRRSTDCDDAQAAECLERIDSAYSSAVAPATCEELQAIVSDVCAPRADCR